MDKNLQMLLDFSIKSAIPSFGKLTKKPESENTFRCEEANPSAPGEANCVIYKIPQVTFILYNKRIYTVQAKMPSIFKSDLIISNEESTINITFNKVDNNVYDLAIALMIKDVTDQVQIRRIVDCDDCGACCMSKCVPPFVGTEILNLPDELKEEAMQKINLKKGPCYWFDPESKKCKHYEYRPQACKDFEIGSTNCESVRKLYNIAEPPQIYIDL